MALGTEVASLFGTLDLQDNATRQLEGFSGGLDAAADKLKSIGSGLISAGSQLTLATAPIMAFLGASVKAVSDNQTEVSQLNAVLKSTAGVAGVTADSATKLSESLSGVTRFSHDAVLGAENMLLTFTSIGKDIFPDVTKTALDMSQALGQDLKSSAIQLGKALNDPTTGMTALRRVGVQFTDAQEKQIKTMQASGDLMGAQTLILKELQREFGGSAEAAGTTFAGKMDILNHKFEDFQEKIGNIVMPLLGRLTDAISPILDKISAWVDANPQLAQTLVVIAGVAAAAGPVLVALGIAISGIGTVVETVGAVLGSSLLLPITAVIAALALLKRAYDTNFLGFKDTVDRVVATIGSALPLIPFYASYYFGKIWSVVQPALQPIIDWFTGSGPNSFQGAVQSAWNFINTVFIQPIGWMWTKVLSPLLQPILDWFTGSGNNSFIGAVQTAWNFINDHFIQPISSFWDNTLHPALQRMVDFLTGLWNNTLKPALQPILDFFSRLNTSIQDLIGNFEGLSPAGHVIQQQQQIPPSQPSTPVVQIPPGGGNIIWGPTGIPISETPGGSGTPFVGGGTAAGNAGWTIGVQSIVGGNGSNHSPTINGGTHIDTVHFNFPNVTDATKTEEFRAAVYDVIANL